MHVLLAAKLLDTGNRQKTPGSPVASQRAREKSVQVARADE